MPTPPCEPSIEPSIVLWRIGFVVHVLILLTIIMLADLGLLPFDVNRYPHLDKVGHCLSMGLAAYLADRSTRRWRISQGRLSLPAAPLIVLALAGLEEGTQLHFASRSASLGDLLADCAGITIACLINPIGSRMTRTVC